MGGGAGGGQGRGLLVGGQREGCGAELIGVGSLYILVRAMTPSPTCFPATSPQGRSARARTHAHARAHTHTRNRYAHTHTRTTSRKGCWSRPSGEVAASPRAATPPLGEVAVPPCYHSLHRRGHRHLQGGTRIHVIILRGLRVLLELLHGLVYLLVVLEGAHQEAPQSVCVCARARARLEAPSSNRHLAQQPAPRGGGCWTLRPETPT